MKKMAAAALTALLLITTAYGECKVTGGALSVGADAAVVMEYESGRLLFAQNADAQLPVASTTKIMTALLALEQPEPDSPFIVDETAILVEGSSMGLVPGDTVTLRALAAGMLMASGNDAANAAAVRIAGSAAAFAAAMNERAAALGMENSNFVTPSGLDAENHYSTARDMALLARAALGNADFREMAAAKRLRVSFGNPPYERVLYNHNKLLSYYPDAIGVKTGFTKSAGRCLVSAAQRDGNILLCVTLGCPDDWNVHEYLYERYFPYVSRVSLEQEAPILIPVVGGLSCWVAARQQSALSVCAVQGMPRESESRVYCEKFLYAPVKAGDIVGRIVYYIDGSAAGESALVAAKDVQAQPKMELPWWQFWRRA